MLAWFSLLFAACAERVLQTPGPYWCFDIPVEPFPKRACALNMRCWSHEMSELFVAAVFVVTGRAPALSKRRNPQRTVTNLCDVTQEKDIILRQLEKWREQKLFSLLERLGNEGPLEQVKRQVDSDLSTLYDMVRDPMKKQTAADTLRALAMFELQHPVFDEAKQRLQMCQSLLNQRNFDDDKALCNQLENHDFHGLKELLGEAPGKENADSDWGKVFTQRLGKIQGAIGDRMSLAKRSIFKPEDFAREFARLKEAEKEIGEYLKLYKDGLSSLKVRFCQKPELALVGHSPQILGLNGRRWT